ncbi:restriction endonuclease [Streptomyces sp. NPDC053542]|uniref:nSTAND1 domain-containing NTPase n=1 Tax=Streptomyces sp. NPDC053542 TaxID=3365710 RepID=UPI0037D7016F
MTSQNFAIQETQVVVLAAGDTPQAAANARGHLFELFVARMLQHFGYEDPRFDNLNVTSDGIELDVVARHRLTRRTAMAECKAYTSPVAAKELVAFYGKLHTERITSDDDEIDGFFFALPRITQHGVEKARAIESKDTSFRYLNADSIADIVMQSGMTASAPSSISGVLSSDPAIVITEYGIYSAVKSLDPESRTTREVLVWGASGNVPSPVLSLLRGSEYASSAVIRDARFTERSPKERPTEGSESLVIEVKGSASDFEYQLPASPQYFVGRRKVVEEVEGVISTGSAVLVVNAQSGWGKSSLALRLKQSAQKKGGACVVFDTRTATNSNYVSSALRKVALQAQTRGLLQLPDESSWASLASSLETLRAARWDDTAGPVLVFFDQFENVFQDEALTREFRDLALGIQEIDSPLSIGFAWKTDLVGWTESHPYRLRDEIRSNARVIHLAPLGPSEVDTLLRKLEKSLDTTLVRDLKERLREYSQGLPWLFKKLAGHVLSEVKDGVSQAQLVSEALNVQSLFERDLAELTPGEREGLSQIARFAPVAVSEVMERIPTEVVQPLLDRRLIVQVGERLDTYWDIFRDFLINGTIPIEDSFILRQVPTSVGRLLREVVALGGDVAVSELAHLMDISEAVVYNLSRDARHFGVLAYEPTRIRLVETFIESGSKEEYLRARVAVSLRRHRAHSTLTRLFEQSNGSVSLQAFASALPGAFPAVAASEKSWGIYARAFAQWFDYAGVAKLENQFLRVIEETDISPAFDILTGSRGSNARRVFPKGTPGPAIKLMKSLWSGERVKLTSKNKPANELLLLGIASVNSDGNLFLADEAPIDDDGELVPSKLLELIKRPPGMEQAIEALMADPQAKTHYLGEFIRSAANADWAPGTVALTGKQVRGWAKMAGVRVKHGLAST